MTAGEIIRIIAFTIIGALLMFLLQPLIYRQQLISLNVPSVDGWIGNFYIYGALIVFFGSVAAMAIWCILAVTSKASRAEEIGKFIPVWWIIGLLPLICIFIAIGFFKGTDEALLSLTGFFIIDVIWLYWLTTATSTPSFFKFLPPGAHWFRR